MKKFKIITAVIILVAMVAGMVYWQSRSKWDGRRDYRLAMISQDGLGLIAISPTRRMVNTVRIDGKTRVWVPGGMGWYEAAKIEKIFLQEKNYRLVEEIFFYNFGFWPDEFEFGALDRWQSRSILGRQLGWLGYLKYKLMEPNLIFKDEDVAGENSNLASELLDEVAPRDLADSQILGGNLKFRLYNTSQQKGLAAFLGRRMEWAGYFVMSVENFDEKSNNCQVVVNSKTKENGDLGKIISWWECAVKPDEGLPDDEVEVYWGEAVGEMLKYSSYDNILEPDKIENN
ncbi:MAG: hypothetical protein WC686_03720 [Candidatus Shapirobacteria bacterium]|jgi:hypothetical protein